MKSNIKLTYLLGILLGISLSILCFIIFRIIRPVESGNVNVQNQELILENTNLKSLLSQKDEEIEKLKQARTEVKEKDDLNTVTKVKLDIKQGMTNGQIADLLVENEVYPHKNDLLMLLEMLSFDRTKYSKAMRDGGYISDDNALNTLLGEIEGNQYALSDYLGRRSLVFDSASFMKIIYILDIKNQVRYGVKEFEKNSSLRLISDVLIN